jgi:hypothetical protein
MLTYNFWMVKIPLPVRDHVGQLRARSDARRPTCCAYSWKMRLAERGPSVTNNNEVMKKADSLGRSLAGRMRS